MDAMPKIGPEKSIGKIKGANKLKNRKAATYRPTGFLGVFISCQFNKKRIIS